MNYSNYKISLDMHDTEAQAVVSVNRGDTIRRITAVLTENDMPFDLNEGYGAKLFAKLPDETVLPAGCKVSGNVITCDLDQKLTEQSGFVACEFKILNEAGKSVLTTPSFHITVR